MIKMWEKINEKFKKYPARMKVAEKMIELGKKQTLVVVREKEYWLQLQK